MERCPTARSALGRSAVLLCAVALLFPIGPTFAAGKIQIEEILTTKDAHDVGAPETDISLLENDETDTVLRVYGPRSYARSDTDTAWYVLFLARGDYLVPIERGDGGIDVRFSNMVGSDCVMKRATFFRKRLDGKVVGFYAVQTEFIDDMAGPMFVHMVFRLTRSEELSFELDPIFHQVAEKRVAARSCKSKIRLADLVKLVREH